MSAGLEVGRFKILSGGRWNGKKQFLQLCLQSVEVRAVITKLEKMSELEKKMLQFICERPNEHCIRNLGSLDVMRKWLVEQGVPAQTHFIKEAVTQLIMDGLVYMDRGVLFPLETGKELHAWIVQAKESL